VATTICSNDPTTAVLTLTALLFSITGLYCLNVSRAKYPNISKFSKGNVWGSIALAYLF